MTDYRIPDCRRSFLLNVKEVLEYFDTNPDNGHHHATPLRALFGEGLAIALLRHYFEHEEGNCAELIFEKNKSQAAKFREEPQEESNEERTGRGRALDCWLKVDGTLYQVEIKFYAAGAKGWRETPVPGDEEELQGIAKEHWTQHRWSERETFRYSDEGKVLLKMRPPKECPSDLKQQPLICYWGLLHKCGLSDDPLFSVAVEEGASISVEPGETGKIAFGRVWFFSMSAYLRTLLRAKKKTIELELPELAERLERLRSFFRDPSCPDG